MVLALSGARKSVECDFGPWTPHRMSSRAWGTYNYYRGWREDSETGKDPSDM